MHVTLKIHVLPVHNYCMDPPLDGQGVMSLLHFDVRPTPPTHTLRGWVTQLFPYVYHCYKGRYALL